jgi:hypothetical protein
MKRKTGLVTVKLLKNVGYYPPGTIAHITRTTAKKTAAQSIIEVIPNTEETKQ